MKASLAAATARATSTSLRMLGTAVPAFWGRQVERRVPELIESLRFKIEKDRIVYQTFYPSRVLVARK